VNLHHPSKPRAEAKLRGRLWNMAETESIKSLDGTTQLVNANGVTQPQGDTAPPSRPKEGLSGSSKDSIPPPRAALTGKQEHCK